MSEEPFPVDEALLARARVRLRATPHLRFLLGGAGTGKSTVARALEASHGVAGIDMDARIYGSWGDRWDPARHPATRAWLSAADPLAWQLALEPEAFLRFHAAAAIEALDLLADDLAADDLAAGDGSGPLVVDGGFGSLGVVARAVKPASIVCLALAGASSAAVWTADPDRRGFLDAVAAVGGVPDPVARFLALDAALSARMVADARGAGVAVVERAAGTPLGSTVREVARRLRLP